jgi:hypothetical protein
MQKPFDASSLMENLDETLATPVVHDTFGKGPSPFGLRRRNANKADSESTAPPTQHDSGLVAEATSVNGLAEDPINPSHYRKHPSGIECIEVTRHMNFNIGNAIKYIWRYEDKGDPIENLKKAQWYLNDEIMRLTSKR